jgi:hypothetical protein
MTLVNGQSAGRRGRIIDVRPDNGEPVRAVRVELPGHQHLMKVVERL